MTFSNYPPPGTQRTGLRFARLGSRCVSPIFFLLSGVAAGQISHVETAPTATQVILSYAAPDPSVVCSIQISEGNLQNPPVHDVDPALFLNANLDLRAGSIVNGRKRVFVAGKRAAEMASDQRRYSRALQTATLHAYSITCGSATATGQFTTLNIPLGITYNDPIPADPANPGQYAWPDVSWLTHDWMIDPLTGVQLKRLDSPRNSYLPGAGSFVASSGTGWTNPAAAIVDDSSAATYSGTGKDWLRLEIGLKLYQGTVRLLVPTMTSFVPVLNAWCSSVDCASASAADRSIEYCLSADGVTCATEILSRPLPYCANNCTTSDYRFNVISNPTPILADWYPHSRPTMDSTAFTTRSGTVNRNGNVVTQAGGDTFSLAWGAGSKITISNVVYTIASLDSNQQVTLAGNNSGSENGVPYSASNASVLVRKLSAGTQTISLQFASYVTELVDSPNWEDAGDQTGTANCSIVPVTGPNNEPGWHCNLGGFMYWIGQTSGTANRLGAAFLPSGAGAPDAWGYGYLGQAYWDNNDPNSFYSQIGSQNGEPMLVKVTYAGDNTDVGDIQSGQGLTCGSPCWTIQNLTPPSQGKSLIAQVAAFHPEWNRAHFHASGVSFLGVTSTSNKLVLILFRDLPTNDVEGFYVVVDPANGSVIAASPTWAYWPVRWSSLHGAIPLSDPTWIQIASTFNRGPATGTDFAAGRGPYLSQILSGAVNTTGQPCPAQPANSKITDWPTGNQCLTVTVDGEPHDPTPSSYTNGTISTSGTAITGNGTYWSKYFDKMQMQIAGNIYIFNYISPTQGTLDSAPPPQVNATYTILTDYIDSTGQSHLQPALERDTFCAVTDPNNGCPGGYYAGEFFRLLIKNQNTWVLQRGYGGGGATPPPYYPLPANAYLIEYPPSCSYFDDGVYACGKTAVYWNFQKDPLGLNQSTADPTLRVDNKDQGCCHNTRRPGMTVDAVATHCQLLDGLGGGCYNTRIGSFPDVLDAKNNTVSSNPPFHGKVGVGEPNSVDTHPSHTQLVVPPLDLTWFTDGRPFLGDKTFTGSPDHPGQLVAGTLYKFTASQFPRLRPREMPTLAACGAFPLLDVSGPNSTLSSDSSGNYKYCYALQSGECAPGSSPGDVYVNCPLIATPYCNYPGIGADPSQLQDICIADMGAYTMNLTQISGLRPDPAGAGGRRITAGLVRYRWLDEFSNVKTTPDGHFMFFRTLYVQGLRNALIMAKLPPFPHDQERGNPNRGDYIPISVHVTPTSPRVSTATVEFGYDLNFFCTSRSEVCVKGAASTPAFSYVSEHPAGVNCASGCTIAVPAISQRILYYRIVQRDSAGAVVGETLPQAQAVP